MARTRTASKLEWLQNRPDLQTPEGQRMLRLLDYQKQRVGEKLDPLLPWLTREWKRGRVHHEVDPRRADLEQARGGGHVGHLYYRRPYLDELTGEPHGHERIPFDTANLSHWADWYNSQHPTRAGVDIGSKQFQIPQMAERIKAWDEDMARQAEEAKLKAQDDAEVLHSWPDGWTVRNLKPHHLDYEGDVMGHCVGGYGYEDAVRRGDTAIVSLRDPQNRPHVTAELQPTQKDIPRVLDESALGRAIPESLKAALIHHHDAVERGHPGISPTTAEHFGYTPEQIADAYKAWQGHPGSKPTGSLNNAKIVQIQGKSDNVPISEYQQRMKDWFQTFPEDKRPNWDYPSQGIRHIGDLVGDRREEADEDEDWAEGGYGPHGDYGLVKPEQPIHYGEVLKSLPYDRHAPSGYPTMVYRDKDGEALYNQAVARGEIPQFAQALEDYEQNHAMPAYEDHENQNWEYYPQYPGESYDEEPEPGRTRMRTAFHGVMIARLKSALKMLYREYQDAEEQKLEHVPEMQASHHLYSLINPHYYNGAYQNEPSSQPGTFSKVARRYGPHLRGGEVCHCPFGRPGRTAHSRQASKLEWLQKRPDMQTEEGKKLIKGLTSMLVNREDREAFDAVLPWVVREVKKGRVRTIPRYNDDSIVDLAIGNHTLNGEWISAIGQYLAEMKRRGKGIDIMQQQAPDVLAEVRPWWELKKEEQEGHDPDLGEIVYQWPDGWTMRRLRNGYEAEIEGDNMGNCVGGDSYGYRPAIDSGDLHVYSLRSPANKPHATIAIDPDGSIEELEDRSGRMGEKYKDRVMEWYDDHNNHGRDLAYEGYGKGGGHHGPVYLPAADDVRSYLDLHSDQGEYHEYLPEEAQYQEEPDVHWATPEFSNIASNMYDHERQYDNPTDEDRRSVFETALQQRHFPELNKAMNEERPFDEEGERVHNLWQQWAKPYYHPFTGEFVQPDYNMRPITEEFQKPLFEQPNPNPRQVYHPVCPNCGGRDTPTNQTYENPDAEHSHICRFCETAFTPPAYAYPQYQAPAWEGLPTDQYHTTPTPLTYAKTAAPLYYRWCFSPTSGEVTIAHNGEQDTKLHGDLARERNEPGLVHGYAYRIGGGFRLTDFESKPLTDPFIAAQVMRTLRGEEGYRPAEDVSQDWSESNDDFDRQHHNIPLTAD